MSQYRDGVFSSASPAPRYGSLMTAFENGSLGGLEEDAAGALDPVLDEFAVQMAVTVSPLGRGGTGGRKGLSGSAAVNLAKDARRTTDINQKLALTIAAAYAASHFGLPENTLLVTVGGICDTFAMTGNQRTALHQQAMLLYKQYIVRQEDLQRRSEALLEKGNAMSGVFRDGVLGSAFRDGVLGHAYQDGSLGHLMPQQRQVRDGSLGLTLAQFAQSFGYRRRPTAITTALPSKPLVDKFGFPVAPDPRRRAARRKPVSGLGCGCAGIGEDAAPTEAPFYKNPLVIGGAAVALGIAIYALKK